MISLSNEVEQVVQDATRNRRLFTAHDVTKLLRDKLDGENIRHNDVKRLVHEMFENDDMGIYTRTQVDVGTRTNPFVYHLNHQDPTVDYDKDWASNKIQASQSVTIDPMTGNIIDDDDDDDGTTASVTPHTTVRPVGRRLNAPSPTAGPIPLTNANQLLTTTQLRQAVNAGVTANANDGFKTRFVTKDKRLQVPTKMLTSLNGVAYVRLDQVQKMGKTVKALVISSDMISSIANYTVNSDGRLRISRAFLTRIGGTDRFAVKSTSGSVVVVAE